MLFDHCSSHTQQGLEKVTWVKPWFTRSHRDVLTSHCFLLMQQDCLQAHPNLRGSCGGDLDRGRRHQELTVETDLVGLCLMPIYID